MSNDVIVPKTLTSNIVCLRIFLSFHSNCSQAKHLCVFDCAKKLLEDVFFFIHDLSNVFNPHVFLTELSADGSFLNEGSLVQVQNAEQLLR